MERSAAVQLCPVQRTPVRRCVGMLELMTPKLLTRAVLLATTVSMVAASLPLSAVAQGYNQPPPDYNNGGPPPDYNNGGPPPDNSNGPPPDYNDRNGASPAYTPPSPNYPNDG